MFLKIASINFWGLKKPLSIDKELRLNRLIHFIKNNNLSIICLQEVWLKKDLDFIEKNLKSLNYNLFYQLNPKKTKNLSGLLILSKYKIKNSGFLPFSKKGYELIFKKGILFSDLIIKKNYVIRIINTHFIATFNPLRSIVWKSQLEKLYSFLNTKKTLIFGDFNYNFHDFPFPDLFLISNHKIPTRNTKNFYNKKALNRFSKVNMLCDLIYSNFPLEIIEKKTITDSLISDHYPVLTTIKI